MPLISFDDIQDAYIKVMQRGSRYLLSKFSNRGIERTRGSFNIINPVASHWWIIPAVEQRWNQMITRNKQKGYEEYLSKEYFCNYSSFRFLSIGSGTCFHEIELAKQNPQGQFICVDMCDQLLQEAKRIASDAKLKNIEFVLSEISKYPIEINSFDVVFFHGALHHFFPMESFIQQQVISRLKQKGLLIAVEYVGPNRLQYSKDQISKMNKCLKLIPKSYRVFAGTKLLKRKIFGPGRLRMWLQEPSECADSAAILPTIHKYFQTLEERPYGGNLLMGVLKDISHHFVNEDPETGRVLQSLFLEEDEYLAHHASDFVFGVYQWNEAALAPLT